MNKRGALAFESLWMKRAGVAALIGSLVALLGFFLLQTAIGGDANFEGLREAHDKAGQIWGSGVATCVGYVLLAGPLYFLFRAAQVRSDRVRAQLVGLAIAGPILLGVSGLLLAAGTQDAADTYIGGSAESTLTPKEGKKECAEARKDEGAKDFAQTYDEGSDPEAACELKKQEEDKASNAIKGSGFVTAGQFAGLAGGLTLVVALFYVGLWTMRTGLLSRFWGSLGMAVGVAALIGLTPLALLWFFYVGVLLIGILPGGLPPAWAAGEAVPWPSPGEKAAAELEGETGSEDPDEGVRAPEAPALPEETPPAEPGEPRRKRKRRD